MGALRDKCDKPCARLGHFYSEELGGMTECPCLRTEKIQQKLGPLFVSNPKLDTPLLAHLGESLLITGEIDAAKKHLAGAALSLQQKRKSWARMDAQEIMDIWLGKDDDIAGLSQIPRYDLLFLFLGFGEMKNKELPAGIMNILDGRKLHNLPTWVVSRYNPNELIERYDQRVAERLNSFKLARQ